MKIAGGCAHVATVIYYLSNARYKENFKLPGEHLKDIFYNKEIDFYLEIWLFYAAFTRKGIR